MATTTTLNTLLERIVKEMPWPAGNISPVIPVASLAAASAQTSLIVASAAYSSGDANRYNGVGIYMTAANSSLTAPEGEWGGRVTRGGFAASTGTFAISPGFSADPNITPTIAPKVLLCSGFHISEALEAINQIQRDLYLPRYLLPTLIPDGDLEAAGVTNWTNAVGTPTKTKDVTTVLVGMQSLKIVTSTSGHAVTSANVPVTQGEQLSFSSAIKLTAGSLQATLYDVTNSTAIQSVTVDETAWTEVRFQATAPSGCQNVSVRYASATASTTAYVGWCSLLSQDRRIIDLPSQIEDAAYIDGIYHLPFGRPSEASNAYIALTEPLRPHYMGQELRDWRAVNAQRIEIGYPGWYPLLIRFKGKGSTFTGINATTSEVAEAPEELIVQGALANLKKRLAERTRNPIARAKIIGEANEHLRNYNAHLNSTGLLRPTPKMQTQNRVRVP